MFTLQTASATVTAHLQVHLSNNTVPGPAAQNSGALQQPESGDGYYPFSGDDEDLPSEQIIRHDEFDIHAMIPSITGY